LKRNLPISGSVIDVNSGEWLGQLSGLGAGIDSFFEYLLKVILSIDLIFNFIYSSIELYFIR